MGRLGAIVAPVLVGALMDKGWEVASLYYLFAVPFLFAVLPVNVIMITLQKPSQWHQAETVEVA
ncbi:hypothetical protein MNJPNG_23710 [Cupriavidus oxalaticus]